MLRVVGYCRVGKKEQISTEEILKKTTNELTKEKVKKEIEGVINNRKLDFDIEKLIRRGCEC